MKKLRGVQLMEILMMLWNSLATQSLLSYRSKVQYATMQAATQCHGHAGKIGGVDQEKFEVIKL